MKRPLSLILLIACTCYQFLQAQSSAPGAIQSIEAGYEAGSGGGNIGLLIKANKNWLALERLSFHSSVAVSPFYGSENFTSNRSSSNGYSLDTHLRFYTGLGNNIRARRIYWKVEAYLAYFHAMTRGTYTQESLSISREYSTSEWAPDYGSRISLGYQLNSHWGLQLALTNSWKQIGAGLGPLAGLFAAEPDGKMSLGIGFCYSL